MPDHSLADVDLGAPINWEHPLARGLVAYYVGLPATSGGARLFNLATPYHAALQTSATAYPTWLQSPFGAGNTVLGIKTDGTSNWARAPIPPQIPTIGTGDFTIGITAAYTHTTTGILFGCHNAGTSSGPEFITGSGLAGIIGLRAAGSTSITDFTAYNDGVMRQFVGVRRGGVGYLYVNGVLAASGALTDAVATPTSMNFCNRNGAVLCAATVNDGFFHAFRGLTTDEVKEAYRRSRRGWLGLTQRLGSRAWPVTIVPVGRDLQAVWNVRSTVGQSAQCLWNVRSAVGQECQSLWNVLAAVGADASLSWNVRAAVGRDLELLWNVLANEPPTVVQVYDLLLTLTRRYNLPLTLTRESAFDARVRRALEL